MRTCYWTTWTKRTPLKLDHRRLWHGLTTPLLSSFLFTNLFSITFLYFFIISSLFPYLTCSCQYSYNLMLTSNCMCRPYIGVKPLIHQSELRTYESSPFSRKMIHSPCSFVKTTEWNGLIKIDNWSSS
jgi:hypothetical protein